MLFTIVNTGVDFIAQNWLNKTAASNWTLHLYVNNHTPAVTDSVSAYTECTTAGYASIALTPGNWTGSSTGGTATYNYPAQTFTFTSNPGGTTVYGAYLTNAAGTLICAGLLDTAFAIPGAGGSVTLTLQATET